MKRLQYTSISIKNNTKASSLILLISLISTISCTSFCDYCRCYNEEASSDSHTKDLHHVINCDGNQLINKHDLTTAYKMQTLEWPERPTNIIGLFNNLNLTVLPRFV